MIVDLHFERNIGRIARGWNSPSAPDGVGIVVFNDQPATGVTSLATLGLSHHIVDLPSKSVRQELLLGFRGSHLEGDLAMLLVHLAERIIADHRALTCGEVVPLGYALAPGSKANHLFTYMPVPYAEELATCNATNPPTVIVWLFPILPSEVAFIERNGRGAFEDLLEQHDPDFLTLRAMPSAKYFFRLGREAFRDATAAGDVPFRVETERRSVQHLPAGGYGLVVIARRGKGRAGDSPRLFFGPRFEKVPTIEDARSLQADGALVYARQDVPRLFIEVRRLREELIKTQRNKV